MNESRPKVACFAAESEVNHRIQSANQTELEVKTIEFPMILPAFWQMFLDCSGEFVSVFRRSLIFILHYMLQVDTLLHDHETRAGFRVQDRATLSSGFFFTTFQKTAIGYHNDSGGKVCSTKSFWCRLYFFVSTVSRFLWISIV